MLAAAGPRNPGIKCNVLARRAFIGTVTAAANEKLIMTRTDLQNSDTDEDALLKEARSDSAAFAQLYRLHYDNVFRYCARRLFNRHTAEDVTSIVFFKVMRTIHSFKGDPRDFRNWLYRIATNAVNDHLRTARRRADAIRNIAPTRGSDHAVDHEADVELQEMMLPVKQALLTLKPKYQTVITLRFFEKLKLNEIADILGQNPATTRSQLSRALSSLRKKLDARASRHGEVER